MKQTSCLRQMVHLLNLDMGGASKFIVLTVPKTDGKFTILATTIYTASLTTIPE